VFKYKFWETNNISFVIYQMGKVGSKSISDSLAIKYGKNKVLHTHNHQEAKKQIEQSNQRGDVVVVVTGFREPLTRCISAYFQNLTNNSNHWYVGEKKEVMNKSTEWLINDYEAKVLPHVNKAIAPWLNNYENIIGSNIEDFNNMGSCWKMSQGNMHFYIYKLETMADFLQEMKDDMFMKGVKFAKSNIGEVKWSGEIYKEFKSRYRISKDDYDSLYGNIDYVRYLYSKHESRKITKNLFFNDNQNSIIGDNIE
jgi:hypothetical protein